MARLMCEMFKKPNWRPSTASPCQVWPLRQRALHEWQATVRQGIESDPGLASECDNRRRDESPASDDAAFEANNAVSRRLVQGGSWCGRPKASALRKGCA